MATRLTLAPLGRCSVAKFRKKPLVIEAVPVSHILCYNWSALPGWVREAYDKGWLVMFPREISIGTLEGRMLGGYTDWLVRGTKGEVYPVKDDIFRETYEPVE